MSGGGKGGGGVPDFNELLQTQARLNRINVVSPFGTVRFQNARRAFGEGGGAGAPATQGPSGSPSGSPGLTPGFGPFRPGGGFPVTNLEGGGTVDASPGPGSGFAERGGGGLFGQQDALSQALQRPRPRRVPNTAVIEFSPEQQKIFEQRQQGQQGIGQLANSLIGGFGTGEGSRERIEDALFSRGERLLNPVFDRQFDALETSLANRGLPLTGEAFQGSIEGFNRDRSQAFLDLSDRAVGAGGAEQSRQLNQILGLLSGQQVQGPPVFPPSAVDATGAAGIQAQQNAASQAGKGGLFSGLGQLGGAGILASAL